MIETLVVDDDFRVAGVHAEFVTAVDGFHVAGITHTARDAYEQVSRLRPDLVLLDLYLPDEHGLDLMRRIGELDPPVPDVIVITAARDMAHVRTAMQQGAVHYLVKPFGFADLSERLASYRDLHARLVELGSARGEADQQDVDALFRLLHGGSQTSPPKGQSAPTLRLITELVRRAAPDISASEVAEALGISRPTAQRYLSLMARRGLVELRLQYGSTGRPEHRYRAVGRRRPPAQPGPGIGTE